MSLPQSSLDALSALLSNPEALRAELARRQHEREDAARQAAIDVDISQRIASGTMFSRRAYPGGPAVNFPIQFREWFNPFRYKFAYGGRGSTKSWSVARILLIECLETGVRTICTREVQKDIKQSVHELLKNQIQFMEMQRFFRVWKHGIECRENPGEFAFTGLSDKTIDGLKSYENFDRAWVEEAASVTSTSWTKLRATIRKSGSQIQGTYNTRYESDPTYIDFGPNCVEKNALIIKINWRDNPWFNDELEMERQATIRKDPKGELGNLYLHHWEGHPLTSVDGAIYGEEMQLALDQDRIRDLPRHPAKPVYVITDLGFGDKTALWFCQPYGGYLNFIDCYSSNKLDIDHYVMVANQRYPIAGWVLPHDSTNNVTHRKLLGTADKTMALPTIMKNLGCTVDFAPALTYGEQHAAAVRMFTVCRFDRERCAEGVKSLRHYQWEDIDPELTEEERELKRKRSKKPLHNWASHYASSFNYACMKMNPNGEPLAPDVPTPEPGFWNISSRSFS